MIRHHKDVQFRLREPDATLSHGDLAEGRLIVYGDLSPLLGVHEDVPRIDSAMQEVMLAKPKYANENNTVTLTLRNKASEHKETILAEVLEQIDSNWESFNSSQRQIISLLFENLEATIEQMIRHAGVSDQAIRDNLKKLEELGIIERVSDIIRDPQAIYRFKRG